MYKFTISLSILVLISSCGDLFDLPDADLAPHQAEYAIPIINSKATLMEILEATDEQVRFAIQPNGTLELIYNSDALSISADEILLPFPILTDVPIPDSISVLNFNFLAGFRGERAIFKNNSLSFKVTSPDSDSYSITIRIPKFLRDGQEFSYTLDIPVNSSGLDIQSDFIDLTGIELQSGFDQIEVIYDARNAADNRVELSSLTARIDFLIFSYLEGSFGRQVFDIPSGEIPFNTFRNYISGQVNFDDPRLLIVVDNSIGLPIEPRINNLGVVTRANELLPLTSPLFFPGTILFDYPELNEVGLSKQTTIELNKTNSNILDVLTEQTESVSFDIDAIAFPNNDQETIGFIRDDGRLDIRSELILPVAGTVEDYVLFDDYPIDSLVISEASALTFNLGIDNGLPVGVTFQIHFVGQAYNIIDSLFAAPIQIPAATLAADGTVIEPSEFLVTETLLDDKLRKIEPSGFIRAYIGLTQPEGRTESITVQAEHQVKIRLGARIKLQE